jgi:DNA-binding NarL/FixJ family response regulator
MMFRQGIRLLLETIEDLEVVGEVGDGLQLVQMARELSPDIVLVDISMPGLRGLEATREIKAVDRNIKVLILTMHKDTKYLYHALSSGAEGYLVKEDADTELFDAINIICSGGTYISPLLSVALTDDVIRMYQRGEAKPHIDPLTTREREVLTLIAEGKSNKEIAQLLFISVRTAQHHRANIMNKLNIRKTADLVRYAIRCGYACSA